jgi:hypothetical protein
VRADLDDYVWLVSDAAEKYLSQDVTDNSTSVARARVLRNELGAGRAQLVLDQLRLRQRARRKFSEADRLFFTPKLLEQATDEAVAQIKARRFADHAPLADLCCGIGGDLFALARLGRAVGVDCDPAATILASANCRALGLHATRFVTAEAQRLPWDEFGAWHMDPDRRAEGQRTAQPVFSSPPLHDLQRMVASSEAAAIKLAPAADVPTAWQSLGEREWIGSGRECRQQVIWFGSLAQRTGSRSATAVTEQGVASFAGSPNIGVPAADQVGRYLVEPHAAVLAAHLDGALAAQHDLAPVSPGSVYLTGDRIQQSPLWAAFEVIEVLPFDRRKLKQVLRRLKIGQLQIKSRGLRLDPRKLQRQLSVPGQESATLLVAGTKDRTLAVLGRRFCRNT